MNAFFASVEQSANPELRGKPIAVVGGHGRTVITTSSYEARAKGVKTGMAIWEGKRTCPELIIVVGDNKKYTHTSTRINEVFRDYTPEVEAFSIDESWLDVTHSLTIFGSAENIAYLIKARIKHLFGVGKKMQRHINMMSIYTCGELGRCDESRLTRKFGIIGKRLKQMGQGIDNSPVVQFAEEGDDQERWTFKYAGTGH
jgi:DNA polymerase-4